MADCFKTTSVRSGAIYGENRNIGEKILKQKPIPKGIQQVHRIHVHDLARIVQYATKMSDPPPFLNAVDLKSETTQNVADWLIKQPFFPSERNHKIIYHKNYETRKFDLSEPERKISNHCLVEKCRFQFIYPTFQEGLKQAFLPGSF